MMPSEYVLSTGTVLPAAVDADTFRWLRALHTDLSKPTARLCINDERREAEVFVYATGEQTAVPYNRAVAAIDHLLLKPMTQKQTTAVKVKPRWVTIKQFRKRFPAWTEEQLRKHRKAGTVTHNGKSGPGSRYRIDEKAIFAYEQDIQRQDFRASTPKTAGTARVEVKPKPLSVTLNDTSTSSDNLLRMPDDSVKEQRLAAPNDLGLEIRSLLSDIVTKRYTAKLTDAQWTEAGRLRAALADYQTRAEDIIHKTQSIIGIPK